MNQQRINELAVEAGAYWREGYTEQPNGDLAWREKAKVDIVDMDLNTFAELIVKETTNAIIKGHKGHINPALARESANKHFGVEE